MLEARRCAVRIVEPNDRWDIEVSVGLLVAARISTAVLWRWTPVARVGYRLRAGLVVAVLIGAGLMLSGPSLGLAVLGGTVVIAAMELAIVRARVGDALRDSSAGAQK